MKLESVASELKRCFEPTALYLWRNYISFSEIYVHAMHNTLLKTICGFNTQIHTWRSLYVWKQSAQGHPKLIAWEVLCGRQERLFRWKVEETGSRMKSQWINVNWMQESTINRKEICWGGLSMNKIQLYKYNSKSGLRIMEKPKIHSWME